MSERKHIKVVIFPVDSDTDGLVILEQTHRGLDFGGDGGRAWEAPYGFRLESGLVPDYSNAHKLLFMQGSEPRMDRIAVFFPSVMRDVITKAITAYNKHFSGEEEPQFGDGRGTVVVG